MSVIVNFVGRLGADAETVTTGSTPFISCRVAVDEMNKKEPQTRWITVNGNADSFKNISKYLTKGKLVQVRGVERVSPYIGKNGEPGVDTRVWADGIDFISVGVKQQESQQPTDTTSKQDEKNAKMTTGGIKKSDVENSRNEESQDDDLPF